jgi:hypothetical protein
MVFQHLARCFSLQAFWRDVEQPQGFIPQTRHGLLPSAWIEACMQTGCCNPTSLESQYLILHEGHKRRNHHHQTITHQRWELIAKRLTSSRWQHCQRITTF